VKLNPLAEWTHDEVWDYLARTRFRPTLSTSAATVDRLRAVIARSPGRADPRGPVVVGDRRAEGVRMHCSIETGGSSWTSCMRSSATSARVTAVLLKGEEVEVARAEVEAVRAASAERLRGALDELLATLDTGAAVEGRHSDELDRLLTLALQSGLSVRSTGRAANRPRCGVPPSFRAALAARRDDERRQRGARLAPRPPDRQAR
jgi:hypothetical protein